MKNLNYLVQSYKMSRNIISTDHDQQFLQWFINGMQEMSSKYKMVPAALKGVALDIVNNEANLPADYQKMMRIGICCNGVFINFDLNDDICLTPNGCECNEETVVNQINSCCNNESSNSGNWWYPMYGQVGPGQPWSYSYTAGSYAIGPGFNHFGYKIDVNRGKIVFDKCIPLQSCVMEYVGDFLTEMGNAFVPETIARALLLYAEAERRYWSPDPRVANGEPSARAKYYQEVRDINADRNALTYDNWVDLLRKFVYQGIKS